MSKNKPRREGKKPRAVKKKEIKNTIGKRREDRLGGSIHNPDIPIMWSNYPSE